MIAFLSSVDKTILFFIQTNFHFQILDKVMILATAAGDKGLIWIVLSLLLFINKRTQGYRDSNTGCINFECYNG